MDDIPQQRTKPSLRRPKPQLSCNPCRLRKLKCDRTQPCKNCRKLPPGSCVYAGGSSDHRAGTRNNLYAQQVQREAPSGKLQQRIRQLEQKVASLAELSSPARSNGMIDEKLVNDSFNSTGSRLQALEESPRLRDDESGVHFTNPSHWQAILDDIAGIKDELEAGNTSAAATLNSTDVDSASPYLLFQSSTDISRHELTSAMPSRTLAESLLQSFIHDPNMQVLLTVLHTPTLTKHFANYWGQPESIPLPWLSLFFSIFSSSLQNVSRQGTVIEGVPSPEITARFFTAKAAQCLVASDYSQPVKYTIEAMIVYMSCEHYWNEDSHFRASLVLGLVVRLALRLGYHRDPKHYPHLSVFESEMRRRTWAFVMQLDLTLATKCGLPRLIDDRQADTTLPLNLCDQDLDECMSKLPIARTEETCIGFLNYKTRLLSILGRIVDSVNSSRVTSYDEVLDLDQQLNAIIDDRPTWLQPPNDIDRTSSTILRLNLWIDIDLVKQRARMMLHRKYLVPAHSTPQFSYSRHACLTAAEQALQDQYALFEATQTSADTSLSNWRFLSLSGHDFLLAATLLCLDINQCLKNEHLHSQSQPTIPVGNTTTTSNQALTPSNLNHITLLRQSLQVWTAFLSQGPGAHKAVKVLQAMLNRFTSVREPAMTLTSPASAASAPTHFPPYTKPTSSTNGSSTSTPSTNNTASAAYTSAAVANQPLASSVSASMCQNGGAGQGHMPSLTTTTTTTTSQYPLDLDDDFFAMSGQTLQDMDWSAWDAAFQASLFDL